VYAEERNREDWRTAVIACTLLNVHRTKESQPVKRPEDIMPWLAQPQSPRQMRAILEAVTLELGGTVAPRPAPGRKGEKKKRRGK